MAKYKIKHGMGPRHRLVEVHEERDGWAGYTVKHGLWNVPGGIVLVSELTGYPLRVFANADAVNDWLGETFNGPVAEEV